MVTPDLTYQLYRFTFAQIARASGISPLDSLQSELVDCPDYAIVSALRGVRSDWLEVERVNAGHDKSLRRDNPFVDRLTVEPEEWL